MDAISQTTFWSAFSWIKMSSFLLKFHWSLFLTFQLTIFQHCFRYWLGAVQATSHYLNQWWLVYWRIYASLDLNELKVWYLLHSLYTILILGNLLWNCSQVNAAEPRWWKQWLRQWLGAVRHQSIVWAISDPDLRHHMASLGHGELNIWYSLVGIHQGTAHSNLSGLVPWLLKHHGPVSWS